MQDDFPLSRFHDSPTRLNYQQSREELQHCRPCRCFGTSYQVYSPCMYTPSPCPSTSEYASLVTVSTPCVASLTLCLSVSVTALIAETPPTPTTKLVHHRSCSFCASVSRTLLFGSHDPESGRHRPNIADLSQFVAKAICSRLPIIDR